MYARMKVPTVLKQWVAAQCRTRIRPEAPCPALRGHPRQRRQALRRHEDQGQCRSCGSPATPTSSSKTTTRSEFANWCWSRCGNAAMSPSSASSSAPAPTRTSRRCCANASSSRTDDVYDMEEEVDYTTLFELLGLPLPALHDAPWSPLQPLALPDTHAPLVRHDPGRRHPRPSSL